MEDPEQLPDSLDCRVPRRDAADLPTPETVRWFSMHASEWLRKQAHNTGLLFERTQMVAAFFCASAVESWIPSSRSTSCRACGCRYSSPSGQVSAMLCTARKSWSCGMSQYDTASTDQPAVNSCDLWARARPLSGQERQRNANGGRTPYICVFRAAGPARPQLAGAPRGIDAEDGRHAGGRGLRAEVGAG